VDKKLLKEVIVEQARDLTVRQQSKWRECYQLAMEQKANPFIVIISGVRRCGKSVLMQQVRNSYAERDYFLNFDDERLSGFSMADFQMLEEVLIELYGLQQTFFFDEIQLVPEWERFVRRLHNRGAKVFITGSNASMLSKELGTHLTGRFVQIEMYPFSFNEIVHHELPELLQTENLIARDRAVLKKRFNEFLEQGGFPEYLATNSTEYLQSLYQGIAYRDILVRYNLARSERQFKELVTFLASNISKDLSFLSLAKMLGVASGTTAAEYCHYLENSFLSFIISRFDYSLKKQARFGKKQYFIDQAMAKVIGFRSSADHGRVLENIVFLELKRRGQAEVYFHQTVKECDFILRKGMEIVAAIQVTASMEEPKTRSREIAGLLEAMQNYQLKEGLILTDDSSETFELKEESGSYQITVMPVWQWLLGI
jgi:predicted AAA+ superfamily ATPase